MKGLEKKQKQFLHYVSYRELCLYIILCYKFSFIFLYIGYRKTYHKHARIAFSALLEA